jgi:hypothetical protein
VMGPLLPGSPSQSTSPVMQPPVFKPASEAESVDVLQTHRSAPCLGY